MVRIFQSHGAVYMEELLGCKLSARLLFDSTLVGNWILRGSIRVADTNEQPIIASPSVQACLNSKYAAYLGMLLPSSSATQV